MPLFIVLLTGCSSIHSKAVRALISKEGEKLQAATQVSTNFIQETSERVALLKKAGASLDTASAQLTTAEHIHGLIFGASQNIASKTELDAHAVAYLIAATYLAEQSGLDAAVKDQFAKDAVAVTNQAQRIQASWQSLVALHEQVQAYAKQSGISGLDPNLIAALVQQIPGGSEEFAAVLKQSEKVNESIEKAFQLAPLSRSGLREARPYLSELMDLMERVKASPQH